MKKILIGLLIVIIIFASIAFGLVNFLPDYLSNTANSQDVEILVSSGDNLTKVAEDLYEKEVIRSRYWFRYHGSDMARNIRPGTYTIPSNTHIDEIYEIIQKGQVKDHISVTFPEGYILYQFAQRVEQAGIGTKEEFIDASNRYFQENSYETDTSNHYFNMEGYLFPDTYHFDVDQTVDDVVNELVSTMDRVFTDQYLNRMEELNLTKHEVLTIASLIEREAYNDDERETVSGVIYNRLNISMALQIDATVIYGIGEGKEHMTRVLYSDLEEDNPYNTYRNQGLPPGPIASPGKNSVHAALYPQEHNYLFYVLNEEHNGHVFAETYEQHKVNERAYKNSL